MPHYLAKPGSDWSDKELAELHRLRCVCEAIPEWDFECSTTDEGEPWCDIIHMRDGRTLLHIARLDRRYVAIGPHQRCVTATMAAAVDQALEWLSVLQSHQSVFTRSRRA